MPNGHGGNIWKLARETGRSADDLLDFSANINPLGPPEWLRPLVSSVLSNVSHYPEPDAAGFVEAVAYRHGIPCGRVIPGNGSTETLFALARAVQAQRAVIPSPSYLDYATACQRAGLCVERPLLREEEGFALSVPRLEDSLREGDIVFIGQPNNPTGRMVEWQELRGLAQRRADCLFVIDEAFADFVGDESAIPDAFPNAVVLRSMTKMHAVPGLRLGYAVASPEIARRAREQIPPWSMNILAQAVGVRALQDTARVRRSREFVAEQRARLLASLRRFPEVAVYPGQANFLFAKLNRGDLDARELARRLLRSGIAIRVCDNYEGLDHRFFRVAVRTEEDNERLCDALGKALGRPVPRAKPRRARALMLQGTASSAGKSVLATALCRILVQEGVRVAPFKAQNMSLNSFVTLRGEEMGRAQATQAQACRLEADVRMNPVLLKPNSETGSQVVLMGRPVGNRGAAQAGPSGQDLFATVKKCYDSLADEYDAMVIEGAGSPAEVNLKARDMVNMRMARHAKAPVLVVGDIDRGGVFGAFVGTMETLAEWERRLVAGFVVNRFRGDERQLGAALEYTRFHTGRPVFGVVPYLSDLGLPEEDSVEFKSGAFDDSGGGSDGVEIRVIDLPHISNFNDFDPLRLEPDARMRVARKPSDLQGVDAVILPGSKNTLNDLRFLRETGLADALLRMAEERRSEIVGICAGFQMLGARVFDPNRIESQAGEAPALGLLDATTELAKEKTLTRVEAHHLPTGLKVRGYEIHHGVTDMGACPPVLRHADGAPLGVSSPDGRVWGTCLHGLFDSDGFRRWWIDRLRSARGLRPVGRALATYDIEPALDRLAEAVRERLDMEAVYRTMGLA